MFLTIARSACNLTSHKYIKKYVESQLGWEENQDQRKESDLEKLNLIIVYKQTEKSTTHNTGMYGRTIKWTSKRIKIKILLLKGELHRWSGQYLNKGGK